VAEFWRGVEPIVQPGKTLIISHQMRKPSQNGGNPTRHQASGSTDIMAGVDDALAFVRRGKDAFLIERVKCRDEGADVRWSKPKSGTPPSRRPSIHTLTWTPPATRPVPRRSTASVNGGG
jgi:hypothetical protein